MIVAAAIVAGISEGTWAFLGVLVANAVLLFGLFYRQSGMRVAVDQINTAVNHQPEGDPTLIERVITLELQAQNGHLHRDWEREAFQLLAHEVGAHLPEYPDDCLKAS
jgi:hypothetical protein